MKYLEKCLPDDKPNELDLALKAERVGNILNNYSKLLTYDQWLEEERVRHANLSPKSQQSLRSVKSARSVARGSSNPIELESGVPRKLDPEAPVNSEPMDDMHSIPGSMVWTTDCAVCLSEFSREELVRELVCSHIFHSDCIQGWFMKARSAACPLCRNELHSGVSAAEIHSHPTTVVSTA